jgi:hypothetical protein
MMSFLRRATFGRQAFALALVLMFSWSLAGPTQATITPVGLGAFPPDVFPGCAGCTLLASFNSGTVTSGLLTFDLNSAVYLDPSNTFGAGDLDFMYQVSNSASSSDSITRVTAINFTGFLTDVGFTTAGASLPGGLFVNGTVAPQLVDRLSAATVGFSFNAPLTLVIAPGETSTVLIIETDATQFTAGTANIIDGSVATVDAFEPASSPTPEPVSALLMGTGLLSIAVIRRLRRSPN